MPSERLTKEQSEIYHCATTALTLDNTEEGYAAENRINEILDKYLSESRLQNKDDYYLKATLPERVVLALQLWAGIWAFPNNYEAERAQVEVENEEAEQFAQLAQDYAEAIVAAGLRDVAEKTDQQSFVACFSGPLSRHVAAGEIDESALEVVWDFIRDGVV